MDRNLLTLLVYVTICSSLPSKPWEAADEYHTPHLHLDDEENTSDLNRKARQIETTVAELEAETTEAATETPEAKVTLPETPEDARTTPSELAGRSVAPRFYSKLSYFQKNEDERLLDNLLESKLSRRKFRSKCRCEKISNCPKLQMSVGRCPTDYFMCCF